MRSRTPFAPSPAASSACEPGGSRAAPQGTRIDLRRTLRASIATGGSPQKLRFRAARRVRPRFVLLLDVSRSMSLTSFFYLRVARALSLELGDVHVFLYHTHLTPVSEALRDPDPWRAQERLQLLSAGWAGGTRIGECLGALSTGSMPAVLSMRGRR